MRTVASRGRTLIAAATSLLAHCSAFFAPQPRSVRRSALLPLALGVAVVLAALEIFGLLGVPERDGFDAVVAARIVALWTAAGLLAGVLLRTYLTFAVEVCRRLAKDRSTLLRRFACVVPLVVFLLVAFLSLFSGRRIGQTWWRVTGPVALTALATAALYVAVGFVERITSKYERDGVPKLHIALSLFLIVPLVTATRYVDRHFWVRLYPAFHDLLFAMTTVAVLLLLTPSALALVRREVAVRARSRRALTILVAIGIATALAAISDRGWEPTVHIWERAPASARLIALIHGGLGGGERPVDVERRICREVLHVEPAPVPSPPATGRAPGPIVLIMMDSVRADHVGVFGYPRNTTPQLAALAKTGVAYESAHAQGSDTRSSTISLMSGKFLSRTVCHPDRVALDSTQHPTLPVMLRAHGYRTAAVVEADSYLRTLGLDAGFEEFKYGSKWELTKTAKQYIAAHKKEPFFLWVFYEDPHAGYERHSAFDFGEKDTDRYDSEIAFDDAQIGRILDGLKKAGLDSTATVIVTSDHGEEFQDHGGKEHAATLFEEVTHVPLIVRGPRFGAGARDAKIVSLVDLMPTILDVAGIPAPSNLDGTSLLTLNDEPSSARFAYSERCGGGRVVTSSLVTSDGWKLIVNHNQRGARALFDLRHDPRETDSQAGAAAARARENDLRAELALLGTNPAEARAHCGLE